MVRDLVCVGFENPMPLCPCVVCDLDTVVGDIETRVRALRAKTRIFPNIWPLAGPNIAENLLGEKAVLASGGKKLDFRNPTF